MTNRATTGESEGRLKGMLTHKDTDYLGLPVGGQYLDKGSKADKVLKIQNCNDCLFISLTEEKQENTSEKHICLKYNRQVFHRNNTLEHLEHNFLYPCKERDGKDFIDGSSK